MHSVTLSRLQSFEDRAKQAKNPRLYLQLLSPMHAQWHARQARRVGFLMFHWHVIEHFKAAGLEPVLGVHPDRTADFSPGGRFAEADFAASMQGIGSSRSLTDLESYSQAIESWHNEAHMTIGQVTGLDMMNPTVNVFFTEFWNLHYFINARFEEQLRSYADAAHPDLGLQDAAAIIAHIETNHHTVVRRI